MNKVVLIVAGALLAGGAAPAPALAPTAVPAPATDQPRLAPTKDASLGYHLAPSAGEAIDVRVTFRAGGTALRVDLPDTSYVLAIPATHRVTIVVPLQRTIAELGWAEGPQSLFLLDERMRFTRKAELTIAGQRCTQWEQLPEQGHRVVCVTAEGLLLRNQFQDPQGRKNLVEAFVVNDEPVPDVVFAVPPDFEHLVPENGTAK